MLAPIDRSLRVRAGELWLGRLGRLRGLEVEAHVVLPLRRGKMDESAFGFRILLLPGIPIERDLAVVVDIDNARLRVISHTPDSTKGARLGIPVVADDQGADVAGTFEVERGLRILDGGHVGR